MVLEWRLWPSSPSSCINGPASRSYTRLPELRSSLGGGTGGGQRLLMATSSEHRLGHTMVRLCRLLEVLCSYLSGLSAAATVGIQTSAISATPKATSRKGYTRADIGPNRGRRRQH